jgi:hypothetical protein
LGYDLGVRLLLWPELHYAVVESLPMNDLGGLAGSKRTGLS